jgi:hypothetical protein
MVRFFVTVRTCGRYAIVVLAVVTALGLATLSLNPRELDSALGLILFVQMFLASSGFATAARRGHFDPLLLHGADRRRVLVAHWFASVLPGAVAWLIVALSGWWLESPAAESALVGERLIAFLIVSALGWSGGFLLPRGAAGALWVGALLALLVRHADLLPAAADPVTSSMALRRSGAIVMCPFLLIGEHPGVGVTEVIAATCMAATVLLVTWRLGSGLDVYLVERT